MNVEEYAMGRPRSTNPMRHTAVAMPAATLTALKTFARANNTGVSTIVRQLVEDGIGLVGIPSTVKENADGMVQSAVWLSRAVHAELKAAGGDRGLGVELRRRLDEWRILHDQGYRVRLTPCVYKDGEL